MLFFLVRCAKTRIMILSICSICLMATICITIYSHYKFHNTSNVTSQGLDIKKLIGLNKSPFSKASGDNITIAIVDSGLALHHDISINKILAFKDFVGNKSEIYDDNGHGTFIAGIINANGKLRGIAPDANLVIIKALDSDGTTNLDILERSLDWLIDHKNIYNLSIINISIGIPWNGTTNFNNDVIMKKLNILKDKGVLTVMSAGNNGPDKGTVLYPANSPDVITVGYTNPYNTYEQTDDKVAYLSSRGLTNEGHKPDLLAPGVDITSLNYQQKDGYLTESGSSYASAIVSGTLAVLMECFQGSSSSSIEAYLLAHTEKLNDYDSLSQGDGQIHF